MYLNNAYFGNVGLGELRMLPRSIFGVSASQLSQDHLRSPVCLRDLRSITRFPIQ